MSTNRANANQAEDLWHYAVGSDKRGPVARAALGKLLASGEISAETYVWQPGMDSWVHLAEVDGLKDLVSGIAGDAPAEPFVEEDTTFMPSDQLRAAHQQMSEDMSQDTVVESIDSVFGAAGLATAAREFAAAEKAAAPAPAAAVAPVAAPAPAPSADDIFSTASSASANPFGDDSSSVGVHERGQSSVLFKLDDLGRDQAAKPAGGGDAFVTDSSGLIDIKAVATSAKAPAGDPFSGANLVMPPRAGGATLAVPLVGKRRSVGPWIFASVALLAVVGVVLVLVLGGDKTPETPPAVAVAAGTETPAPAPGTQPAAPPAVAEAPKPEGDKPAAEGDKPAAEGEKPAAEGDKPAAEGDKPAAEGDKPAAEGDKPAAEGDKPAAEGDTPSTPKKPATTVKRPEPRTASTEPKVEPKVEPAPSKPATSTTNTSKVDNLLAQLDGGKPKTTETSASGGDSSLPDKLSAAAVRSAIRGRFDGCGAKLSGGGPVTIQTSFVISSSGVVQSARITDAGGTSADVQRCVVQQIKETTFGKFKDSTMTVNLPVRLL